MLKFVTITTLIVIVLSFSGCFLTEKSTPDARFGFWIGIRDGLFLPLRLIVKIFQPVDLFANHRRASYTVGFLLSVSLGALELGASIIVVIVGETSRKPRALPAITFASD